MSANDLVLSQLTDNSLKCAFEQLVLVHGEESSQVRLAFDFMSSAIESAINGDIRAWSAALRLAGEFATEHVYPGKV